MTIGGAKYMADQVIQTTNIVSKGLLKLHKQSMIWVCKRHLFNEQFKINEIQTKLYIGKMF